MLKNFRKHFSPLVLASIFALTGGIFAFAQNGASLSVKDQADVFEDAWKLVNEKYYDPKLNGVDWASVREKYKPLVANAKNDAEFNLKLREAVHEKSDELSARRVLHFEQNSNSKRAARRFEFIKKQIHQGHFLRDRGKEPQKACS